MDSAKLYLWRNIRNEPKLPDFISGQSSRFLNPPVSEYFLPGGAALFSTFQGTFGTCELCFSASIFIGTSANAFNAVNIFT